MEARPFVLVASSAITALNEAANQALARWATAWGASGDEVTIDVVRLEEAALPGSPDEWQPLHAAWLWKGAGLQEHVAAALGLPSTVGTSRSMSAQSISQAADDLAAHITSLLRDLRELAKSSRSGELPAQAASLGRGLVLVTVRRGLATLALLAEASSFKAGAPASAAPTPNAAIKPTDLDASLRAQTARLEVILGQTDLSLADMMGLGPGDVLLLDRHIHQPIVLSAIDGRIELPVHLGRQGDHFAVQLMRPHQS